MFAEHLLCAPLGTSHFVRPMKQVIFISFLKQEPKVQPGEVARWSRTALDSKPLPPKLTLALWSCFTMNEPL
jgi:hypothetical protein